MSYMQSESLMEVKVLIVAFESISSVVSQSLLPVVDVRKLCDAEEKERSDHSVHSFISAGTDSTDAWEEGQTALYQLLLPPSVSQTFCFLFNAPT